MNNKEDMEKQTIGDSGWGPISAGEVINELRSENTISWQQAEKFATNNKLKAKKKGVTLEYFKEIFKKYGIGSKVTDDKFAITNDLANGNNVVFWFLLRSLINQKLQPEGEVKLWVVRVGKPQL